MKVAASPRIYGAMPEGLLIAGFPRIASLPLEGKVPRRGGYGTGGMKESGKERLKSMIYESTRAPFRGPPSPMGKAKRCDASPRSFDSVLLFQITYDVFLRSG